MAMMFWDKLIEEAKRLAEEDRTEAGIEEKRIPHVVTLTLMVTVGVREKPDDTTIMYLVEELRDALVGIGNEHAETMRESVYVTDVDCSYSLHVAGG